MEKINPHHDRLSSRVLKTMSLFGSVQMVHIICSVVRTKLVAIFIGPAGVGLFGIFNSAIDMTANLTQLGIGSSAVRDIAGSGDENHVNFVVRVVRRWGWILGAIGAAAMLLAAPLLSESSFGDSSRAWQFRLLAVCLALNALTATNVAVMQGLKRYRNLARTSLMSAVGGIAVAAPLYYFMGIDSIIPSLIGGSIVGFMSMLLNRPATAAVPITPRIIWNTGKSILSLGFFMTVTGFCNYLASYAFISWLNVNANVEVAGHFQAGYTMFYRYTGLVFTSLAVEYYPRLSSVAASGWKTGKFVNHETALLLWILMPAISLFILAAPLLVRMLYSEDFMTIVPFVSIGIVGTVLRAVSWCMAFTILARGDGKLYLLTELTSSALYVALNIAGYHLGGLTGVGIAYIVWFALYTLSVGTVYSRVYKMRISPRVKALMALALTTGVAASALSFIQSLKWMNIIIFAAGAVIAIRQLRRLLR